MEPTTYLRRSARLLASALFGLAFAAVLAAAPAATAPAKSPTSPDGIIINHKLKADLGISCEVCHSPSAANPALMGFPSMDTCATCHADETDMSKGTDKCSMCHTRDDYSSSVPKDKVLLSGIVFSHEPHAAAKVDCLSCHKILDKNFVSGTEMLPSMNTCVTCHQAKKVPKGTDCATCHTNQAIGSEKPASHTALWLQSHGKALSKTTVQNSCVLCHTAQSGLDCNSCHQREAPASHNGAWTLSSHGQAARVNSQSCSTCHTQQQCLDCHTQEKPWTHTGNWGSTGTSSGDQHCVTCHVTSGTVATPTGIDVACSTCHTPSSAALNHQGPHRLASHTTNTACLGCHNQQYPAPRTVLHPMTFSTECASCHPHD